MFAAGLHNRELKIEQGDAIKRDVSSQVKKGWNATRAFLQINVATIGVLYER